MIRPRWKKVLSDLLSNKIRSLLVIASVAVGLFAVGMIETTHIILAEDITASYALVNPANIQVRAESFDHDFVEHIQRQKGVRNAEGIRTVDLRVKTGSDQWRQINIKAIPDIKAMKINQVDLVEGTWPPNDKQIVLDINKLPDTHAKVGDFLQIKLPSGDVRQMKLVGVVHDQTIGSASGGGGFFLSPIQGYVTFDTLPWLEQPSSLNLLYVSVSDQPNDLNHIQLIADRINHSFDANSLTAISTIIRRSIDHPNTTYLDAISKVLFILGLLVVFLSGFLITNTLSALLNQQIQQIGVLKTIGGVRYQIIGIYMVLILAFSALALLASIPLSYQVSFVLLRFLARKINFNLQSQRLVMDAVLLQVIIALVVPQVAGAVPILQGTRITIQEALSGIGHASRENPTRTTRLFTRLRRIPRPFLISLRNTFRKRIRLFLTLVTLTLGGAIFISTFNVRQSLENQVNRLRQYFIADINLTFNQPYLMEKVELDSRKVPGIAAVEGWAAARAELIRPDNSTGESVQILAPPLNSKLVRPILLAGRWIEANDKDALAISELFLLQYPNIRVGDTLKLKLNGEEVKWLVVGVFQFAGKSSGFWAYTNYETLARKIHMVGKSNVFRVIAQEKDLNLSQQELLGERLEITLKSLGYQIADIRPGLSLQESTTQGFNILTTFLMIMALLMAAVGSIGLTGTMSLNILERTREIGVMRAIGGSDRIIMSMVIVEGMLIGFLSWVLACLVALPISQIMSDAVSDAIFSYPVPSSYTPTGILIWLFVVLILSVVASIIPAYNASRLTIREVLAYE